MKMNKGFVTKIIGGIVILSAVVLAVYEIPNWGWIAGGGFLIILVGSEQEN